MTAQALATAVDAVRRELAERYPVLVDTTRWSWSDGVQVQGGVLVAAQARAFVDGLAARLAVKVPSPAVLSSLQSAPALHRWRRLVGDGPVDLHRHDAGDDLQTQWTPPAVVRSFASATRVLVQLPDGTVGWVDGDRVGAEVQRDDDPWSTVRRPVVGEALVTEAPLDALAAAARARLGRPYRWGGNAEAAADCSGYVQSLIWGVGGVLLPKHTGDQRKFGARVGKAAIEPGDVVFVRGKSKRIGHVGVALPSPQGTTVAHSCLTRNVVIEESAGEFLDRYVFQGARRVVTWS